MSEKQITRSFGAAAMLPLTFLLLFACAENETQTGAGDKSQIDLSLYPELSRRSLLIDKSDYEVFLMYENKVVKSFHCVLGPDPVNDKRYEGDGCTPEGTFRIRDKYPHSKWKYFLWVDYPNEDSWQKHNASKAEGMVPENTGIGGEIGVHGVPAGREDLIDNKTNWTLGCISVKNTAIEEIYRYLPLQAIVIIRK